MSRGPAHISAALVAAAVAFVLGTAVGVAALGGGTGALSTQLSTPNVLFIVTDDQPLGSLDVMPNTRRRFRSQGTEFSETVVTTPQCCPSRSGIFTGRYAHNTTVKSNDLGTNLDQSTTLQRYLKDAGYRTAIFGKYLNDWNLSQNPQHFDRWAIYNNGPYSNMNVNEQGVQKRVNQYTTTYSQNEAIKFINEQENDDSRPWFLHVSPIAPHLPATPETKYQGAPVPAHQTPPNYFESDRTDKPPYVQADVENPSTVELTREEMLRTLKSVDDMVGSIFRELQNSGETRDTLAFFISDNGWLWGEHGLDRKGKPYTASIKVPMYMRWPGRVAAGETDTRLATNLDLPVTVMEAVGVDPSPAVDGRSLLDSTAVRDHWLTEYWRVQTNEPVEPTQIPPWASIRTPTFQYVEYYDTVDEVTITFREYYDLVNDPWQLTNLLNDGNIGNDPPTAALSAQLAAERSCAGSSCP